MFQFLIGTIKTHFEVTVYRPGTVVSIPHRYDQNMEAILGTLSGPEKFQFLIGTIKTQVPNGRRIL